MQHIDGHVSILKRSGAEILVFAGVPATASQVIRLAADSNWHPVFLLNDAAASIGTALGPAGVEKSAGVISASFLKDPNDPAWKDDPAIKDWLSFMDRYYPKGDKASSAAVYGYAAAETLVQVLKQCGDDLSRENVMRQAAALKDYQSLRPLARHQDQHGSGEFPADQADAIGSVRWPHLAADRGRDRKCVFRRSGAIVAGTRKPMPEIGRTPAPRADLAQ